MLDELRRTFQALDTHGTHTTLRYVASSSETLSVRQDVVQPLGRLLDRGVMLTVTEAGSSGYAATSDFSKEGLTQAFGRARAWAVLSRKHALSGAKELTALHPRGLYRGPGTDQPPWERRALLELLRAECATARVDSRVVDWSASVERLHVHQLLLTQQGGDVEQEFAYLIPNVKVTASDAGEAQTRSLAGQSNGYCRQGGLSILEQADFHGAGRRVADEALALLEAPNCPHEKLDLLLLPDQMMLQIHESIGHPLELDRILGDERNYAGTSFVSADMFGSYQYGSPLLNVTYDPSLDAEFASYRWDDDGSEANKTWLIRDGVLLRGLGGQLSQARSGLEGVANSRASSWNRAPIDRMANLNIEPGKTSLQEMIRSVERGVLMNTNVSWSIDDSRNKFQFGCEWGQLIENGELGRVVKNSNYRGISATFWRSLSAVGDAQSFDVRGTPYCGKGEPNQVVRVGHAAPACLFRGVEVFGGEG